MEIKNMAYWKKKNAQVNPGPSPNKFWAQVAGALIGANKKRQAKKDEGDAAEAAGKQQAYSGGLS